MSDKPMPRGRRRTWGERLSTVAQYGLDAISPEQLSDMGDQATEAVSQAADTAPAQAALTALHGAARGGEAPGAPALLEAWDTSSIGDPLAGQRQAQRGFNSPMADDREARALAADPLRGQRQTQRGFDSTMRNDREVNRENVESLMSEASDEIGPVGSFVAETAGAAPAAVAATLATGNPGAGMIGLANQAAALGIAEGTVRGVNSIRPEDTTRQAIDRVVNQGQLEGSVGAFAGPVGEVVGNAVGAGLRGAGRMAGRAANSARQGATLAYRRAMGASPDDIATEMSLGTLDETVGLGREMGLGDDLPDAELVDRARSQYDRLKAEIPQGASGPNPDAARAALESYQAPIPFNMEDSVAGGRAMSEFGLDDVDSGMSTIPGFDGDSGMALSRVRTSLPETPMPADPFYRPPADEIYQGQNLPSVPGVRVSSNYEPDQFEQMFQRNLDELPAYDPNERMHLESVRDRWANPEHQEFVRQDTIRRRANNPTTEEIGREADYNFHSMNDPATVPNAPEFQERLDEAVGNARTLLPGLPGSGGRPPAPETNPRIRIQSREELIPDPIRQYAPPQGRSPGLPSQEPGPWRQAQPPAASAATPEPPQPAVRVIPPPRRVANAPWRTDAFDPPATPGLQESLDADLRPGYESPRPAAVDRDSYDIAELAQAPDRANPDTASVQSTARTRISARRGRDGVGQPERGVDLRTRRAAPLEPPQGRPLSAEPDVDLTGDLQASVDAVRQFRQAPEPQSPFPPAAPQPPVTPRRHVIGQYPEEITPIRRRSFGTDDTIVNPYNRAAAAAEQTRSTQRATVIGEADDLSRTVEEGAAERLRQMDAREQTREAMTSNVDLLRRIRERTAQADQLEAQDFFDRTRSREATDQSQAYWDARRQAAPTRGANQDADFTAANVQAQQDGPRRFAQLQAELAQAESAATQNSARAQHMRRLELADQAREGISSRAAGATAVPRPSAARRWVGQQAGRIAGRLLGGGPGAVAGDFVGGHIAGTAAPQTEAASLGRAADRYGRWSQALERAGGPRPQMPRIGIAQEPQEREPITEKRLGPQAPQDLRVRGELDTLMDDYDIDVNALMED